MIPLSEARAVVLAGCAPLAPRPVRLRDALGLVTADDVVASESIPPFANTAVDGFAVRAEDLCGASSASPIEVEVVGTVAAGAYRDEPIGPGQAVRIMTGAPLPPGADALVMVEDAAPGARPSTVRLATAPAVGDHVRAAGDDVRPGAVVVPARTTLSAAHLGVLASLGVEEVSVHPRVRVGVVSTGDELVEGPTPLRPGQIRDSNRVTLLALVSGAGADAVDFGIAPDDEGVIRARFTDAAETCDAVISSGGVSMGDYDYVKAVLDEVGKMTWMQVAIKPAKPLAFGHVDDTPVFGLPGNPVSSMVSFELFARPALRAMMGHAGEGAERPRVVATAPDGLPRRADGKVHFLRVVARYEHGGYVVRSAGGQGSHQLTAMAAGNALAVVDDGDGVAPGGSVEVLLLR